ncbi:MAG: putative secreted protein [uncultured Propionibacteriaceae bacterium]|uniref:Putative secreted protein n=1 Tax=uncultured Propionibacteriaceae bacterium TaxID=257457 RepID=A0A6J4N048_9ACTN|nr:MAG: putative secreted protein [uncultured Propionibacteriaceae bacterium]
MNETTQGGGRRGTLSAAAVAVVLLLVGVIAVVAGIRGSGGPPQPVTAAQPQQSITATPTPTPKATPKRPKSTTTASSKPQKEPPAADIGPFLPASRPTGLNIPSIGVRSSNFVDLEVAKDGTLEVPGSADEVGFYTAGPTPGQLGPAVLGAHVDSKKGPGIFYNLGALKPGAKIYVEREDKSRTTFVVDKVAVYPKDQFPTEEVYHSDFTKSEIRLVTCGGTFDRVRHYLDNVIVFAHLTDAA